MNLVLFGIIFSLLLFVPNIVFGEIPEYCNYVDEEIICEISIVSSKHPLPDYIPDEAKIPKDAKIIFNNDGFIVHTATSTDASPEENTHFADKGINGIFDTGKLLANESSLPITLNEGTYHYFCTVHKEMRGTLIVYDDKPSNEFLIEDTSQIPTWIKNNAGWWADDIISDEEFVLGIKFLIENKILQVSEDGNVEYSIGSIPQWIKNNAKWWSSDQITDQEFLLTIEHLIKRNIVKVSPVEDKSTQSVPATSGAVVNFYVNDDDLNTSRNGIDRISTTGLVVATLNDQEIPIPSEMVETEPNSGRFYLQIELPDTINGQPLSQDDVIEVRYFDQSDSSGNQRTVTSSTTLSQSFAKIQTQNNNQRIGHEFILRIYEPDANVDSKDEDRIRLSALEFRAEGGIRVPLSHDAFDANSSFLIETGPNTDIFEVEIKIPRFIDGETIHIGDWYEIRYIDVSTPSNTAEKIIFKGKICKFCGKEYEPSTGENDFCSFNCTYGLSNN